MYNKDFAEIYNQEWTQFSETLADNVLKLSNNFNSVLDLGCGTGNFLKKLEKRFNKLIGIDISKDMIQIAKQNCYKAEFHVASVTDFDLGETFDLITCNFDMINHLNTIYDWEKCFKLAYKHLKINGIFLFDINTIFKYGNLDIAQNINETDKYKIVDIETRLDANHVKINIEIFNKQGKKLAFIDEIESFYNEETVVKALENAGFKNITFVDKDLNPINDFERNRLFVICKKQ